MENTTKTKQIAALNDKCRAMIQIPMFGEPEVPCKIRITRGIQHLPPKDQIIIFAAVRNFDDFKEENDPYGEHDFGSVEHNGTKVFWKIDYYDTALQYGSEAPEDIAQTIRVLTIMLASEY